MNAADYSNKLTTAAEALAVVRSGDGVYIQSNAAAPQTLIAELVARADAGVLRDITIYQLITLGAAPYTAAQYAEAFRVQNLFVGHNTRKAVNEGRANYVPLFFSDLVWMFESQTAKVDVCLLQCSPPDKDGYLTLGVSLDTTLAAMKHARVLIAEVNPRMPRTYGLTKLHVSQIHHFVEVAYELPELPSPAPQGAELEIGRRVAELVEDGATIQMGIGAIPNAVLLGLREKRDLGVHSEMFSDGVVELVEAGVITNNRKTVLPGKMAVSFSMGTRKLYDFLDNNPSVEFHGSEFINDPFVIAQNYKMTAINSALQIDLTGQICADSLGTTMYSGCGGQVDFVRGAWRSEGGKAIIAIPATAKGGTISRIVPTLQAGAGVVTSRADVHWVVTEYGAANLRGLNLSQRVRALIGLAAPQFRDELERQCEQFPWFDKSATGGKTTSAVINV